MSFFSNSQTNENNENIDEPQQQLQLYHFNDYIEDPLSLTVENNLSYNHSDYDTSNNAFFSNDDTNYSSKTRDSNEIVSKSHINIHAFLVCLIYIYIM